MYFELKNMTRKEERKILFKVKKKKNFEEAESSLLKISF